MNCNVASWRRFATFVCVLAACGNHPRYLGAPLPAACSEGDVERCAGWLAERDLVAGQLAVYDDPRLQWYVQQISDRLARNARVTRSPRVVIGDHDGTYAAFGDRIVIGRRAIERLGSEAELAAIVAHELVHVEGRHASMSLFGPEGDDAWLAARRDAEAIADERAVVLLERAGYAPAAMTRALTSALEVDDEEHPPRAERLANVTALAAGRTVGFHGRDELLRHVDKMIVGRNTQLGARIADAWIVSVLGVALDLPERHVVHVDGDALVLRHGTSALTAYPIGIAWARELAGELVDRATADTALGSLTVGVAPARAAGSTTPLAKLQRAVRELLPQPAPGMWVVILARPRGGLVIEIAANSDAFIRDRWLSGLRAASKLELADAEPIRIALRPAARAATIRVLVEDCPDPELALHLDDPARLVTAGALFKCTDR